MSAHREALVVLIEGLVESGHADVAGVVRHEHLQSTAHCIVHSIVHYMVHYIVHYIVHCTVHDIVQGQSTATVWSATT